MMNVLCRIGQGIPCDVSRERSFDENEIVLKTVSFAPFCEVINSMEVSTMPSNSMVPIPAVEPGAMSRPLRRFFDASRLDSNPLIQSSCRKEMLVGTECRLSGIQGIRVSKRPYTMRLRRRGETDGFSRIAKPVLTTMES
eukprot:GEMP01042852.1.p1 GENE.GEMP01042852.1~~GEMP01042852.1.p1  ORF type:complete len:140 (+),score=15.59 GEMP01042852.1:60-479(+)